MIYGFGLITIFMAWLLPGHYFPWTGFQQEFLAATGTCLLAMAIVLPGGPRRLPIPWIATVGLALAAVPLLQWTLGMFPFLADAALPSMYLAAFGLSVVAARALTRVHGQRFVGTLLGTIMVAGLASTGIGLVQWLQLGPLSYVETLAPGARVFGNFTQPNHLSTALTLSIVAVLWFYETRRIGGVGASLAVAFLGFGMVMTQSRTGWVFVGVLVVWWFVMRRRHSLRTGPLAVLLGVGVFVAATLAWPPLNAFLLDLPSLPGLTISERMQVGARRLNWATLWDAVWRSPWFGYGWQQVSVAQQAAALDHPPSHEWVTYSHNLVLDLLVWTGVPLGLSVCAAIALWVGSRCMTCSDIDSWAMLAAGGALLIHALLEFPLAYAYFLLPLGIMIGVVEARTRDDEADTSLALPIWAFGLAAAAMTGMLAWVAIEYVEVEGTARLVALREAGYAPGQAPPALPDVVLLDGQREFLWFRLTEARPGMDDQTLNRLRAVQRRFAPPAALLRYALAAGLNGRDDEAIRNLRLVCSLWPMTNCEEGRVSWTAAQAKFPQLARIAFPAGEAATSGMNSELN